jgi:hypothetical protein
MNERYKTACIVSVLSGQEDVEIDYCMECGTLIWTTSIHDAWHDRQDGTARAARRADSMTALIG